MPVGVAKHINVQNVNGVGSFILQCKKITLRYCNWAGSSRGMRHFLEKDFKKFVEQNPKVEFVVVKDHGHPIISGEYVSGREKVICVRNLEPAKIEQKLKVLRDSSGAQLKPYRGNPVKSINESVRGIWSPLHVEKPYRHQV
jgi:large subunit ribosomal protein L43